VIANWYQGKMDNVCFTFTGGYNIYSSDMLSISSDGVIIVKKQNIVPEVKQLIFREDSKTTIVIWKDNTKTIVKSSQDEEFIPEVRFAEALAKKIYGSRNAFLRVVENAYHQPVRKVVEKKLVSDVKEVKEVKVRTKDMNEVEDIHEQNTYE
jgi:hypothetical protein